MIEEFNLFLEHWEPLWLFAVLYGEIILAFLLWRLTKQEVVSSINLENSIGKVFAKYVKRLEDAQYEAFKKLLVKRVHKKSRSNKKRNR